MLEQRSYDAYQVPAEHNENVCVRKDREKPVVYPRVGDDLSLKPICIAVPLSSDGAVSNGNSRGLRYYSGANECLWQQ